MEKTKIVGLLAAVALAILALASYFAPRHSAASLTAAAENQPATVPPQLSAFGAQASPVVNPAAAPAPTRAVVYVCGSVKHPGVYEMPSGSRVADGIERAGGALADANLEELNLAEPVADAMKIDVPRKGERPAYAPTGFDSTPAFSETGPRHHRRGGRSSHKLEPGQTLDVNTASENELTQLPGVGPSLAARIFEYRAENGPFGSIDDLQNVSGIGPSKLDKMAPYVRL